MSTTAIEKVTPALAQEMMKNNDQNRPMRWDRVQSFKRAMESADWEFNGESIVIDKKGKLLDGQHRLAALIEANVTLELVVVRGIDPKSRDTIDQGKNRTFADVLSMEGFEHASTLSATCRYLITFAQGTPFTFGPGRNPSAAETRRMMDRHPTVTDSVALINQLSGGDVRTGLIVSTAVASCLHCLFSEQDKPLADRFMEQLLTGVDLSSGDPIHLLRERLLADRVQRRRLNTREKSALLIKTWNAVRDGAQMTSAKLRFRAAGATKESFPKVVKP